jgi:hypothetical protein
VERAEQSEGLHKRSAEAWGNSLRARGAELPLGLLFLIFFSCRLQNRFTTLVMGSGLTTRTESSMR